MGLSDNSGGPSSGFYEGGNAEIVEEEHHQELVKIPEYNFFGMEGQVERVWKDPEG